MIHKLLLSISCALLLCACAAPTVSQHYPALASQPIAQGFITLQLKDASPHTLTISYTSETKHSTLSIDGGFIAWQGDLVLHELPAAKIVTTQRLPTGQYRGSINVKHLALTSAHYSVVLHVLDTDTPKPLTFMLNAQTSNAIVTP